MAKVTHIGPGDIVSLDGLDIAKGKTVELDEDQIRRLQAAGAELAIDRAVPSVPQAPTTTWKPTDDQRASVPAPAKNTAGSTGKED